MNSKTDKKREDFFKNCEYVVKAPACIFLESDRFSRKAKVLPIPIYAYAGVEHGNFKGFFYEEHNEDLERMMHNKQSLKNDLMKGITKDSRQSFSEIDEDDIERLQCRHKRPHEEEAMIKSDKPISSVKKERQLIYQVYLDTEIKRKLTWKKVVQKDGKTAMEVFTRNKTEGKSAMGDVKETFDELLSKFKDYFKIKVWSEIPYAIGMNDGAAIASAVALILNAELAKRKETMEELTSTFQNLREKHPEEIMLNNDFITVFNIALALDFFSNGAAVFASMLGCRKEQEIIDYECLFYDDFKDSFKPYPEFKDVKEAMDHASNSTHGYFRKCFKFTANPLIGVPLFKWSFSRLSFKNRDELALLIVGRDIVGSDEADLEIPSNAEFKHYRISPANFVILAEPSTIVLCEASPHRHIFGKEELLLSFKTIYSSRNQGWGANGVDIVKPKKELEPGKEEIGEEKLEYARFWNLDTEPDGEPITKRKAREFRKNKARFELLIIGNGVREIYIKGQLKSPLGETLYKLLTWTLKHKGVAGDFPSLLESAWDMSKSDADDMRRKLKNQQQRTAVINGPYARRVMKAVALLNKYFRDSKLGIGLESGKTGQFRLKHRLNYALIEII